MIAIPAVADPPLSLIYQAKLRSINVPHASVTPLVTAEAADPAWATAADIPQFSLSVGPQAIGLSALPTRLQLLWDEKYLYLRYTCHGGDAYAPISGPAANLVKGDVVEAFLDPVGDSREFVEIQVSSNNNTALFLHLLTADPRSGPDGVLLPDILAKDNWDIPNWTMEGLRTAAGKTSDGGWVVDVAIPAKPLLKRLGANHFSPMTFRANFLRYDQLLNPDGSSRTGILMNWSPVIWGRPHRSPAAMGTVTLVAAASH